MSNIVTPRYFVVYPDPDTSEVHEEFQTFAKALASPAKPGSQIVQNGDVLATVGGIVNSTENGVWVLTRLGVLAAVNGLIPVVTQRQDSLNSQLVDLQVIANRLGMYDAADYIRKLTTK